MTFLKVWIIYAVVGTSLFSLAFAWAVRARQFSDLNRGRYIPLQSAETLEPEQTGKPSVFDRLTWPALFALLVGLSVAVLLVAARSR